MKRFFTIFSASLPISLAMAAPGETTCVSVTSSGGDAPASCSRGHLSSDGRFVVFQTSGKMVPEDTNGSTDVYLRDRLLGETKRVSVTDTGAQVQAGYSVFDISGDGRYVVMEGPDHIIPNSNNSFRDVYVHDMLTGLNTRVSVSPSGVQGNGNSSRGVISTDGRYVCFASDANNLVTGDTNGQRDIFRHDMVTGDTIRVSLSSTGGQGNRAALEATGISDDGRFVCFVSEADNLVPGDSGPNGDAFVKDLDTGAIVRANVSNSGAEMTRQMDDASMSANGRYVTFSSSDPALVTGDINNSMDIFVRDLQLGTTELVSVSSAGRPGTASSVTPMISDDGRFIVFRSLSTSFANGDANGSVDVFVADRQAGSVRLVSRATWNQQADDDCDECNISGDGTVVSIETDANGLGGGGAFRDIFVHELQPANSIDTFTIAKATIAGQNRTTAIVRMTFTADFGGEMMDMRSSTSSLLAPTLVVAPLGTNQKSIVLSTFPVNANQEATLTAKYGTQVRTASMTLVPLVPSAFQFTPSPVTGGNNVLARLVLNGVAAPLGLNVNISDNSAFATTPAVVSVPNAGTEVSFTITTLPVVSRQIVTVTASVPQGSKTGSFQILP